MAVFMICATLPSILISPFGGSFSDNFSKRKIVVYTDFISGLIMVFTGCFCYGRLSNHKKINMKNIESEKDLGASLVFFKK